MISRQIYFGLFIALVFASCNETTATKETTADEAETDALLLHSSPASPGVTSAQPATMVTPQAGQNSSVTQGSTQAAKTAAGNPPHGQPGHRCDIEVGAPLNSAPSQQTVPLNARQITAEEAPVPVAPSSGNSNTTGAVNPPHGQPGHDCAIPVGAPLKK